VRTPEDTSVRLLIVEDVATEAEIAVRRLKKAGLSCTWQRVETEPDFRQALRDFKPHLILSDFALPHFDGLSALASAAAEAPDVPFIFLSGTIGEERAIQALKNGAMDYVLKSNLERLAPAVTRALEDAIARRARRTAEERVSRLTRITQVLSAVNAAVVRIRSRTELLAEACRITHHLGGYTRALIVLIEPGARTARPVAWAGREDERMMDLVFNVAETETADTSVTGRAIRTADVCVCHDLSELQTPVQDRERLAFEGMRSLASLPLLIGGTAVGALTIGTTEEGTLDGEELLMLQEMTTNLSFALQYLQKQDAVEFLSYFDPLTGLAKRSLFCERLARMLEQRVGPQPNLTVVALDVQRLSVINDSFGRHVGDRLLECVADRLKRHFDNTDQLANLGGGTFAAVITQPGRSDHALRLLNEQFTALFSNPVSVNGRDIRITIKFGLAEFPENGEDAPTLLQNAEAALRKARESGERYLHHRLEMNSEIAGRLALEQRLSTALAQQQFLLYYQPQIEMANARIVGIEALLRWHDPEHGIVSPAVFLPILESTGLIVGVGEWVFHQAAADCKRLRGSGVPPIRIAVNVSPLQLRRHHFASQFLEIASGTSDAEYGLDIEIVEGALLDDSTSVIGQLQALRAAGVRVAIDDFGTGYSSLSRLSQLPIDMLKIDRSFTSRLGMDEINATVVSTIIQLAKAFGMTTCAEGVETKQQLEMLKTLGCQQAQGYLFSRPVAIDDVERLLHASSDDSGLSLICRGKRAAARK
jgi:diguanylate cyclase (GGDEF)-like protein